MLIFLMITLKLLDIQAHNKNYYSINGLEAKYNDYFGIITWDYTIITLSLKRNVNLKIYF